MACDTLIAQIIFGVARSGDTNRRRPWFICRH